MSDWDGPTPADSGLSRRALLAGFGGAAVLGGAAVTVGPDLLQSEETLASFSGDGIGSQPVQIDADIPLRGTAELTDTTADAPEIAIAVTHTGTDRTTLAATDEESVSARGTTERSGPHQILVGASGEFEATLYRRSEGPF